VGMVSVLSALAGLLRKALRLEPRAFGLHSGSACPGLCSHGGSPEGSASVPLEPSLGPVVRLGGGYGPAHQGV
jgi:hypothetical protein